MVTRSQCYFGEMVCGVEVLDTSAILVRGETTSSGLARVFASAAGSVHGARVERLRVRMKLRQTTVRRRGQLQVTAIDSQREDAWFCFRQAA